MENHIISEGEILQDTGKYMNPKRSYGGVMYIRKAKHTDANDLKIL